MCVVKTRLRWKYLFLDAAFSLKKQIPILGGGVENLLTYRNLPMVRIFPTVLILSDAGYQWLHI